MDDTAPELKRELGLRDITLFAITCIVGTRWIPAAAHAGPGSVTLWLLARGALHGAAGHRSGRALREVPRHRRPVSLDAQRFRPLARLPLFLALLDRHRVLVPQRRHVLHERRHLRAGTFLRLAGRRAASFLLAISLVAIWIALGTNLIGMKIGKWTENLGACATWVLGALLVAVAVADLWPPRLGHAHPHCAHLELGHRQLLVHHRLRHERAWRWRD